MNSPSGVSRRVQQCVERLQAQDCEGALVNLFPAIDKTAKKRRPKEGVGGRIKAFLHDEEVLITAFTGNVIRGCSFDGMRFMTPYITLGEHRSLTRESLIRGLPSIAAVVCKSERIIGIFR